MIEDLMLKYFTILSCKQIENDSLVLVKIAVGVPHRHRRFLVLVLAAFLSASVFFSMPTTEVCSTSTWKTSFLPPKPCPSPSSSRAAGCDASAR